MPLKAGSQLQNHQIPFNKESKKRLSNGNPFTMSQQCTQTPSLSYEELISSSQNSLSLINSMSAQRRHMNKQIQDDSQDEEDTVSMSDTLPCKSVSLLTTKIFKQSLSLIKHR